MAVSRRDHLCAALDARLGTDDVCRLNATGKAARSSTIARIVAGLPSDGYGRGAGRTDRVRDGISVACIFVTVLHSGVLGALLTISPRIWIPGQGTLATEFGLSPLEDQQLAGILMWVPMGTVYTAVALFFAYRWLRGSASQSWHMQAGAIGTSKSI